MLAAPLGSVNEALTDKMPHGNQGRVCVREPEGSRTHFVLAVVTRIQRNGSASFKYPNNRNEKKCSCKVCLPMMLFFWQAEA